MRYFFRRKIPVAEDILLIESGSPEVARRALAAIRAIFPAARYHLLTCWPHPPAEGLQTIFRASDYPSGWKKLRLIVSLRRRGWRLLVILCTGEPFLWGWKVLAAALLPAKILVVNENADFFWLDWGNRKTLRRFLAIRWGVNRAKLFATALRALAFPITLLILLGTALWLYGRRWRRLLRGKIRARFAKNPRPTPAATVYRETSRGKIP